MNQVTIKRNILFIILIGIEGLAFGLIDWDSVVSDLVYLKYNDKLLISIISASVGIAKFIATLVCIYINDSKRPNKIFTICVTLGAMLSLLMGVIYKLNLVILFVIVYALECLILEVYSGYHYAYVYNSLPEEISTQVHSKRISIFKLTFMIGIAIASFLTTKYINQTMTIITIFSSIIFLGLILLIINVKNSPKNIAKNPATLKEKLNLKKYTKYYRSWLFTRFLGKFALSSLVVIVSILAIDNNLNFTILKTSKTGAWILSAIGFWISAYLIKNKIIIKGDILCKLIIAILIVISFFYPYAIFIILLLNGALNPFNTMSNFTMLQMDQDNINVAQKELIINLFGFFASMLSSFILLNINIKFALITIVVLLTVSTLNELKLYRIKTNRFC